jgi:DNA-binding NarL/FixJ family response regulator
VVLLTGDGGSIDITEGAADLLLSARLAGDTASPPSAACSPSWAPLCRHLGRCSGAPDCAMRTPELKTGADTGTAGPSGTTTSDDRATNRSITVLLAGAIDVMAPLRRRLLREPDVVCLDAPNALALQRATEAGDVAADVLVIDGSLCDATCARTITALRVRRPDLRVIAWGTVERVGAAVVQQRFHGLLLPHCPPDMGVRAMRAVLRGEWWLPRSLLAQAVAERNGDNVEAPVPAPDGVAIDGLLTDRQTQIVAHLRQGFTNKEIARRLGIQEDTVKKHLQAVFGKLGVHRRALVALGGVAASARLG